MVDRAAAAGLVFRHSPHVGGREAFDPRKRAGGVIIGLAAAACGFGLIWRIWVWPPCSSW